MVSFGVKAGSQPQPFPRRREPILPGTRIRKNVRTGFPPARERRRCSQERRWYQTIAPPLNDTTTDRPTAVANRRITVSGIVFMNIVG